MENNDQRKWNYVGQIIKDEEGRYKLKLHKDVKLTAGTTLALYPPKEGKEYKEGDVKFNVQLSSFYLSGRFSSNEVKDRGPA
jgi:hypothetical protein